MQPFPDHHDGALVGQTMAEKLMSLAVGRRVVAGDLVVCAPDAVMGTDGSIPMALDYFRAMQPEGDLPPPAMPERLVFAFDHYGAVSGSKAMALQSQARDYAAQHGVAVFEVGEGIGHQLMLERGKVLPGKLVVGADSHAVTYGAFNAFGTGIGSSDLAGILQCGQMWLKVPDSIRIELVGQLPEGSSAKDVALVLARRLGAGGANYCALEFTGPGIATLDVDDRIVLANMSVEMGAKAGIFPCDALLREWLATRTTSAFQPVEPDAGARFREHIALDLGAIVPQVALPHRVDNVVDLASSGETRVDVVYLGTCTGGRVKDYREALEVLRGGNGIAPGVRLIVTPASQAIESELETSGMAEEFRRLGAVFQPAGCGSCCGTCGEVPADGQHVVSTANRNFKGRMGNGKSMIYLASPRSCAQAALSGRLGSTGGKN